MDVIFELLMLIDLFMNASLTTQILASIFLLLFYLPGIEGVNKATNVIKVSRYLHQLLSQPVTLAGRCLL